MAICSCQSINGEFSSFFSIFEKSYLLKLGKGVFHSKRAGGIGGANEASFREDEDYDIYDGYADYTYDLTEEKMAFIRRGTLIFVVNVN
ncbi:hypothetical protein Tco_0067740, partial [Tanacetum coccineum]